MKALVYHKYGSPDNLGVEELPIPDLKKNEVLIKVHSAAINSWDWDLLRGKPFIVRLAGGGLTKPIKKILGCDVAGVITAVGAGVKKFKINDEVFGDISESGWGAFAEYVSAKADTLTLKPRALSFTEAAALPQAAVMALQGVKDHGQVASGQDVLINGAGGGVGSFAIQLAKMRGASVTGVDNTDKIEFMQSMGADNTIDYTKEDFTKREEQYDLILDVVGHHSLLDFKRALKPVGKYKIIGGHTGLIFQSVFLGPLISAFSSKKMGILAHQPNKGLSAIAQMVVEHKLQVIIDRIFTLDQLPMAFRYFGENSFKGKIVISMVAANEIS
ncbi:NAD(P)-dependent alcohol dehydrogenase [Muriicola sp. Z0-33]|uniref:NAD(P)-dependent alcohol dehydrogenase n=1 Tax=Muriicola sp. Z0-33 TaxID=2816957 RepID=UPI002238855D|nr:NAD(P)-dependent alcohol dehydrogenase [Muriicola sp. Z0-33]MCW5516640.1 NAD(P)-dependent alcohol dehydrogenase [Muriicola sp. Z0-33]